MKQNPNAEWRRILFELLKRERQISPLYMTHEMDINQYQRALNTLRKIFHELNIVCITIGRSARGKKITKYELIRNRHTEKKLEELRREERVDDSFRFTYPREEGGFDPEPFYPSEKPIDFPSNSHRIAHENRMKKEAEKSQETEQLMLI